MGTNALKRIPQPGDEFQRIAKSLEEFTDGAMCLDYPGPVFAGLAYESFIELLLRYRVTRV